MFQRLWKSKTGYPGKIMQWWLRFSNPPPCPGQTWNLAGVGQVVVSDVFWSEISYYMIEDSDKQRRYQCRIKDFVSLARPISIVD